MTSGNAELIAVIRSEIERNGPISFARFMECALYHPQHGFYTSGRAKLGRDGDYFTNVSVGPAFGQLLGYQFVEIWQKLGQPPDFVIVEQGAHHGDFARDVLQWAKGENPEFFATVRYHILEPAPILEHRQRETLSDFAGKVAWQSSAAELAPFRGVFFANELLDAFPVHLVSRRRDPASADTWRWFEKRVTLQDGGFAFVDQPLEPPLLARARSWPEIDRPFETEIGLEVAPWIRDVSSKLREGVLCVTDYGFSVEERFVAERAEGSLQVRQRHRLLESPFAGVGEADMTSHVDWDALIDSARACGMEFIGMADQHHFLAGILTDHPGLIEKGSAKIRREVQTLLHPEMLGRSFQALLFGRKVSGELSGLQLVAGKRSR